MKSSSPALLALIFGMLLPTGLAAQPFEPAPKFKASEILQPDMRAGEHFTVREEVGSDGYWDFYTVDTEFGVFHAHGWLELRNLIREINALAYIQDLSKTRVFMDSALEAGLEPVELTYTLIRHPVQTITRIPRGISEMFARYAESAQGLLIIARDFAGSEEGDSDKDKLLNEACARGDELPYGACNEEGVADDMGQLTQRFFEVDDARREWHELLGTDPYTSNKVLQDAITRISWFDGLGEFGLKFVKLKSDGFLGLMTRIHRLAWRESPTRIRKYLRQNLGEMGTSSDMIERFLANPYISPTRGVVMVESLGEMDKIGGLESLLAWAADSRSEDESLYCAATLAFIAWFHSQHPVEYALDNTLMPALRTVDGRTVSLLAVDELTWSEDVAAVVTIALHRQEYQQLDQRQIWLLGRASARARQELEMRGWQVFEDVNETILDSGQNLDQ